MLESGHHILILSGLYGLITPIDPIQLYSVPLYDNDPVQKVWNEDDFLSKALCYYVKKQKIKRIFDFTGIFYYRDLLNWPLLKGLFRENHIDCEILHAFSTIGAGDNALKEFGKCVSEYLIHIDEPHMRSIAPEDSLGSVYFRAVYGARKDQPSDFPSDEERIVLSKIIDLEAKKILQSAEYATIYSYRNPNNPPDAGSTIIWQYGKGLEKLFHCEITKKVGRNLQTKYSGSIPSIIKIRPRDENKIWKPFWYANQASAKQITLGQWSRLYKDLNTYAMNPFVRDIRTMAEKETSHRMKDLSSKCERIEGIRNAATHPKIISFEEGLNERRKIIPIINEIIDLLN